MGDCNGGEVDGIKSITYKGIDFADLGWSVVDYDLPMLPPPKTSMESALDADGSFDFSEFNTAGRMHYNDRNLLVDVDFVSNNTTSLERSISKLAEMTMGGYGELIIPTMPLTVWIARIAGGDKINRDLKSVGIATIPFIMRPFSIHRVQSKTGLRWRDCNFAWNKAGGLKWDNNGKYVYGLAQNDAIEINIMNYGTMPMRPTISFEGNLSGASIAGRDGIGNYYNIGCYSGSGIIPGLLFDFKKQTVFDSIGMVGGRHAVFGDFWEMPPDLNTLRLSVTSAEPVTVYINAEYPYVYEARM